MSKIALPKIKTHEYKLDLPLSKKTIIYRPYNVADEKILLGAATSKKDDTSFYVDATLDVIRGLVLNEIDIDVLPAAEVDLLFTHIRSRSVGEEIEFSYMDGETKKTAKIHIDDFYVTKPDKSIYTIMLNETVGLKMRDMTFGEKVMVAKKSNDSPVEAMYASILKSVDMVFDGDTVWKVVRTKDSNDDSNDITEKELSDFIDGLVETSDVLYSFLKDMPQLCVTIKLEDGEEKTITSNEIDFLA